MPPGTPQNTPIEPQLESLALGQACKVDVFSAKCIFAFAEPLSFFLEFSIIFSSSYRISQDFPLKLKHYDQFFIKHLQ